MGAFLYKVHDNASKARAFLSVLLTSVTSKQAFPAAVQMYSDNLIVAFIIGEYFNV